MVKKPIPKKIEKEIKEYIYALKEDNLPIKKVILFGSYAKDKQKSWSDIDLCIVSPRFKNAFIAMQYLFLKRLKDKTPVISPVGFSPQDFEDKFDTFIDEIKTTGIEISL